LAGQFIGHSEQYHNANRDFGIEPKSNSYSVAKIATSMAGSIEARFDVGHAGRPTAVQRDREPPLEAAEIFNYSTADEVSTHRIT
jgi:hypothetical protein